MRFTEIVFLGLLALYILPVSATLQDPHPFPSQGPWFEGWYTRLVDTTNGHSFAIINALMLDQSQNNNGYLAIMHATNNTSKPMEVFESFPQFPNITDCQSNPVSKDPDLFSPPCFKWVAGGCKNSYKGSPTDCEGYIFSSQASTVFEFTNYATQSDGTVNGVSLKFSMGEITPWDDSGLGPMGIAETMPNLGLYWYVYSLGTKTQYEYTTFNVSQNGETIIKEKLSGSGLAHQEKNWGGTFPRAWIWAQGVSEDGNVHFALAGGPKTLPVVHVEPVLWLVGYRSPQVGSWDLNPQHVNQTFTPSIDACNGHFVLTVAGFLRKIVINIQAQPSTFNDCLYGPSAKGFSPMCLESFVAKATITAYERSGLSWDLIETQTLSLSSLEFGGEYTCKPCSA